MGVAGKVPFRAPFGVPFGGCTFPGWVAEPPRAASLVWPFARMWQGRRIGHALLRFRV